VASSEASPTAPRWSCTAPLPAPAPVTAPIAPSPGGLLGFFPDDERLRESIDLAAAAGLQVSFRNTKLHGEPHPNTTRITIRRDQHQAVVTGSSLGAGRIQITEIDGFPVEVNGTLPTIVFVAQDVPGIVAAVTSALARQGENIATIKVSRRQKGGEAIHIYELDHPPHPETLGVIRALPAVSQLRALARIA
jgi:L-serine dehydratase